MSTTQRVYKTIRREDHAAYYELIRAFEEKTGCAVIINTSFNVNGEPIVCTPYDAYRCLYANGDGRFNTWKFSADQDRAATLDRGKAPDS